MTEIRKQTLHLCSVSRWNTWISMAKMYNGTTYTQKSIINNSYRDPTRISWLSTFVLLYFPTNKNTNVPYKFLRWERHFAATSARAFKPGSWCGNTSTQNKPFLATIWSTLVAINTTHFTFKHSTFCPLFIRGSRDYHMKRQLCP